MSLWAILENATFAYERSDGEESDEEVRYWDSQNYNTAQLLQKIRNPGAAPAIQVDDTEDETPCDEQWLEELPTEVPSFTPVAPPQPEPEPETQAEPTQITQDSATQFSAKRQKRQPPVPVFDLDDDSDDDFSQFFSGPQVIREERDIRTASTASKIHFYNVTKYNKKPTNGSRVSVIRQPGYMIEQAERSRAQKGKGKRQQPPSAVGASDRRRLVLSPQPPKPRSKAYNGSASTKEKPKQFTILDLDEDDRAVSDISDFSDEPEVERRQQEEHQRVEVARRLFDMDKDNIEDFDIDTEPPHGHCTKIEKTTPKKPSMVPLSRFEAVQDRRDPIRANKPPPQPAHPDYLRPTPTNERATSSTQRSRQALVLSPDNGSASQSVGRRQMMDFLDGDMEEDIPLGAVQNSQPQRGKCKPQPTQRGTKRSSSSFANPSRGSGMMGVTDIDVGQFSQVSAFPLSRLIDYEKTPVKGKHAADDQISTPQNLSASQGGYFTAILDKPHDSPLKASPMGALASATPSPKLFKPKSRRGYFSNVLHSVLGGLHSDHSMWLHKLHKLANQVATLRKLSQQPTPSQQNRNETSSASSTDLPKFSLHGLTPIHFIIVHIDSYRSEYGIHTATCTIMYSLSSQHCQQQHPNDATGSGNADLQNKLMQYGRFPLENRGHKVTILFTEAQKNDFNIKPGGMLEIHQPWQEVQTKRQATTILLCTDFMRVYTHEPENDLASEQVAEVTPADGNVEWDDCDDVEG